MVVSMAAGECTGPRFHQLGVFEAGLNSASDVKEGVLVRSTLSWLATVTISKSNQKKDDLEEYQSYHSFFCL